MNVKEALKAEVARLGEEKAAIMARTADLRAERERQNAIASEAGAKARALTDEINAIERPAGERGLIEVMQERAAAAKALAQLTPAGVGSVTLSGL